MKKKKKLDNIPNKIFRNSFLITAILSQLSQLLFSVLSLSPAFNWVGHVRKNLIFWQLNKQINHNKYLSSHDFFMFDLTFIHVKIETKNLEDGPEIASAEDRGIEKKNEGKDYVEEIYVDPDYDYGYKEDYYDGAEAAAPAPAAPAAPAYVPAAPAYVPAAPPAVLTGHCHGQYTVSVVPPVLVEPAKSYFT